MNGAAPAWQIHKTKEGRPYYHNPDTKATVWIKPDELLAPHQLATGWAETSTNEGKQYWFLKADRNKTAWDPPQGWNAPPRADSE